MIRYALRFGGWGGLVLCVLFGASLFLAAGESQNYKLAEVVGYVSIVAALAFVYFGVRSYRDKDLNGQISLGEALKCGLLITAFVAFVFTLFDTLYVTVLDPDFYSEYMEWQRAEMVADGATGEALEAFDERSAAFQGSSGFLLNGVVMFMTVFTIGFIVSMLSALSLRTKR